MFDRDMNFTLRSYATPIAILAVALFFCTGWALSSGSLGPYLLFIPVLLGVGLGVAVSTRLDPPSAPSPRTPPARTPDGDGRTEPDLTEA